MAPIAFGTLTRSIANDEVSAVYTSNISSTQGVKFGNNATNPLFNFGTQETGTIKQVNVADNVVKLLTDEGLDPALKLQTGKLSEEGKDKNFKFSKYTNSDGTTATIKQPASILGKLFNKVDTQIEETSADGKLTKLTTYLKNGNVEVTTFNEDGTPSKEAIVKYSDYTDDLMAQLED